MLFVTMAVQAQKPITFQLADSVSYQYYLVGDWDKLINFGNEALAQDIEFKTLYQRMGYAYFVKQKYYDAQSKYKKALSFDKSDEGTRMMLYYCGLNIGDNAATGFYADKLPKETQLKLGINPFKIVSAVDVEYNFKKNLITTRSNPNYYRVGIKSKLGNRLNLYQTISKYTQSLTNQVINQVVSTKYDTTYQTVNHRPIPVITSYKDTTYATTNKTSATTQIEYYAALNWVMSANSALEVGYHFVNTKVDTQTFPGNMFFAKLSTKIDRFQFAVNSSILTNSMDTCTQIGLSAGYTIPGSANVYLKSAINGLRQQSKTFVKDANGAYVYETTGAYKYDYSTSNHIIFTQTIGAQILKPLWGEGYITLGNLKNYNDNNGLYLYNSVDATKFRTGLSLFYIFNKNISFVGNYTYDKKELINTSSTIYNYNQHSFSGGIIWKL